METIENNHASFQSWLLDKHQRIERTAGVVILFIEMLDIVIHKIFHNAPDIPTTQVLNLGFLIVVYIKLEKEFGKRYTLADKNDPQKVARILRIWRFSDEHQRERIDRLVRSSNKLIGQLHNINYFVLATAGLYSLFLIKKMLVPGEEDPHHIFHLLFDLISYLGAFFLLRCFYVMYLPTIKKERDNLGEQTNFYLWIILGLMVIDFCFTRYVHEPSIVCSVDSAGKCLVTHGTLYTGVFIAEFLCGVINAVVFVLLVSRFQNKILDIPPYILFILYAYAVLQTCLPFVTNTGLVISKEFSEGFSSIVFRLVLIGKLALAAMLLYVLDSGRIVYYFMFLKNLHDEETEQKHWGKFKDLLDELPRAPEPFEITYKYDPDSKGYTATILPASLFGRLTGSGETLDEARENLRNKIQRSKHD